MPLFTDTKGKKKNSVFIFTKHMIKGNVKSRIIKIDATKMRDNERNESVIERVSIGRKRFKKRFRNRKFFKKVAKTTCNFFLIIVRFHKSIPPLYIWLFTIKLYKKECFFAIGKKA